jgi:peptidoglycan/LPS O-acetylase OafA/YrhL
MPRGLLSRQVSILNPRANNFDALRFFAAASVIFSHAFLVAEGTEGGEWFARLTGGQTILGLAGVFVFFTISGYLVTGSYLSDPSPPRFALKRALRIFPGLWVNLLLVGLVLGPIVSALPFATYLSDDGLVRFFSHNLLLDATDTPLPDVGFSDNQVGRIVNGALWTLRYEVMMYLMVLLLGLCGLLRLWVSLCLLGLGIVSIGFEQALTPYGDLGEWAWLVGFFASGMTLRLLGARWLDRRLALVAVLGLIVSGWLHLFIMLFPLFGGYLTIYLALAHTRRLDFLGRHGDLSYGLYIYGWPIEQAVVWITGGRMPWWGVFALALALAILAAWLSWHGVEQRALRLGWRKEQLAPRHRSLRTRATTLRTQSQNDKATSASKSQHQIP